MRTRHRRRFQTDRIVANRRRRFYAEWPGARAPELAKINARLLSYGTLADRDPWDCGHRCMLCHFDKLVLGKQRRRREERAWRRDWDLD